jgi:hypothetical protein
MRRILLGLFLVFGLVLSLGAPEVPRDDERFAANLFSRTLPTKPENLMEDQQIRISDSIDPATTRVAVGHSAIWQNRRAEDIKIVIKARGLATFCREPDGFVLGVDGITTSKRLKPGEIASLCFLEPREYGYQVERAEGGSLSDKAGLPLQGLVQVFETH